MDTIIYHVPQKSWLSLQASPRKHKGCALPRVAYHVR